MADSSPDIAAGYTIRRATLADLETMVRHRRAVFEENGKTRDLDLVDRNFAEWVRPRIDATYFHWLAEHEGRAVASAALLLLDWPPAPRDPRGGMGFVYSVWVDPRHRRRGVARAVMETLHAWADEHEVGTLALHASDSGRPLYAALGYLPTNEMRLDLLARRRG